MASVKKVALNVPSQLITTFFYLNDLAHRRRPSPFSLLPASSRPGFFSVLLLSAHYDHTNYLYAIMTSSSLSDSDPFASESNLASSDGEYVEGATLPVGRDASLTLATDSLIVLGMKNVTLNDGHLLTVS